MTWKYTKKMHEAFYELTAKYIPIRPCKICKDDLLIQNIEVVAWRV